MAQALRPSDNFAQARNQNTRERLLIHDTQLKQSIRWAAGCLITLSLIACGGGGSEPSPDTPVTPTSQDPAPILVSPENRPYIATTTTTTDEASGESTTRLIIIEASTNQVVRQVKFNGAPGPRASWVTRYITNIESNDRREDGYRSVYFIANGKVFRQDLYQVPLSEAKQISNIDNACGLFTEPLDSPEFELVTVITPNASNACDLFDANQQIRITSDMSATDSGVPMSTAFVGGIYNSPESFTPSSLLFYDPKESKLISYSKNLKTSLPGVEIAPVSVSPYRTVEIWFDRKTSTNLLKVIDKLYTLSIANNALVIDGPVVSSTGKTKVNKVLSNLDKTFILFEEDILEQFSGSSQPTKYFSSIPTHGDFIALLSRQSGSLLATGIRFGSEDSARVFYRIKLSDGSVERLGTSPYLDNECFYTLDGDQAWLFTCPRNQQPGKQGLFKRSVKTFEVQTLIADVMVIGVLTSNINDPWEMTHLIYCRPIEDRKDCAGAPILSRNMVTNQEVEIGRYHADPKWLSSTADIYDEFDSSDRLVVHTLNQTSATSTHSVAWTFNPNQANSLIKVSIPD